MKLTFVFDSILNLLPESPFKDVLESISIQSESLLGFWSLYRPSIEAKGGKFPVKKLVSISISVIIPGDPNSIIAQSLPPSLLLLLSHPSIHFPCSSYLSSMKTGSLSSSIRETSPKKSSETSIIFVPIFGEARLVKFWFILLVLIFFLFI